MTLLSKSSTPQSIEFVFGRLNLIANYTDKHAFLLELMLTSQSLGLHDYNWNFFEVQEMLDGEDKFIFGYLVKSQSEASADVVNTSTRTLGSSSIRNSVAAKAQFFLHTETGVIAFHSTKKLDTKIFSNRFKDVLEHQQILLDAKIRIIEEPRSVLDRLDDFGVIMRVSITLHPSNPHSGELWKKVDDDLKALGASSYQQHLDGKKQTDGLNIPAIKADKDIRAKIAMAEDGYGKAEVSGKIGDKPATISTSDKPLKAKVDEVEGESKKTLDGLLETFKSIFSRFLET